MTSINRTFRTRSLESEGEVRRPVSPSRPELRKESYHLKDSSMDFTTLASTGERLSCSAKTYQAMRGMGYDNHQMRDTLHTVDVLRNLANRPIDTVLFSSVKERNNLGLGAMASIATMCNMPAADAGVTIRGAARFYARNRSHVDIEEMERFVKWLVSRSERGEYITGLPSEWKKYCRMMGKVVLRRRYRKLKSANGRKSSRSASSRKSRPARRGLAEHIGRFFKRRG